MVYLITGKKNAGKTSKLKELFEKNDGAHGFSSEKIRDCGRVTMYILTDLNTGDSIPIAKLSSLPTPKDWEKPEKLGSFTFRTEAFAMAEKVLSTALREKADSFFIDELGKLEINGKGLAETIHSALKTDMNLYITVREENVKEAVKTFGIKKYEVLSVF